METYYFLLRAKRGGLSQVTTIYAKVKNTKSKALQKYFNYREFDENAMTTTLYYLDCNQLYPTAPAFLSGLDMDVGVDVKTEAKAEEKRGIEQEIEDWLYPAAEALAWKLNPPEKSWPSLDMKVPRIALLAKRFLCIMTTSAPLKEYGQDLAISSAINPLSLILSVPRWSCS